MTTIEQKFFDLVKKNILIIAFAAVTVLGIVLRACGFGFESGDFQSFLNPWYETIKAGGIQGLSRQVGNYNIPYQIITYILTLFPWSALTAYKVLSVIFDLVLAGSTALLVKEIKPENKLMQFVAYALVFCSLPVIFNSAFWAQCDSIYVSFIILAIYFTLRGRTLPTFIMLGLSLAFKLQVIFILPVFLFWYVIERRCSILHFLIIPAVDIVLCLPAVLLGRSFMDIFTIYADQTDYGKLIQMNFPNIYAFMCDGADTTKYELLKGFSIVLAITVLGIGLAMMIYKKTDLSDRRIFLLTAIWTVFTCLMFLSSMHERYSYLLDILLIIYALVYRKNIWVAALSTFVTLRGYCFYLFTYAAVDLKLTAAVYVAVYAYVTWDFVKNIAIKSE